MSATKLEEAISKIEDGVFAPELSDKTLLDDEPEEPVVIYDREKVQNAPITVQKGTNSFDVSFDMRLPSDEEYFKASEAVAAAAKREGESILVYMPYGELGRKLAVARYGYKERSDWREKTDWRDLAGAVKALLLVAPRIDETKSDDLLDEDAEVRVELIVPFDGKTSKTAVYFREMSNPEIDEFLLAMQGKPPKDALASAAAAKEPKERRLYKLGMKVKTRFENYANDDIPAWQLIEAIQTFAALEFMRVGKL